MDSQAVPPTDIPTTSIELQPDVQTVKLPASDANKSLKNSPFAESTNELAVRGPNGTLAPSKSAMKGSLQSTPATSKREVPSAAPSRIVSWHDDLEHVREFEPSEAAASDDFWEDKRPICCCIS